METLDFKVLLTLSIQALKSSLALQLRNCEEIQHFHRGSCSITFFIDYYVQF